MNFSLVSSPYVPRANRVHRVMQQVLLALVPAILAMTWIFGWGILINIMIAVAGALASEALVLKVRGHSLDALRDHSAVLTAVLLAMTIPPTMPWWLTLLGASFAIILVKQLYGGLGYNPFNPAMAGYIFLLISYPVETTRWLPPETLAQHSLGFMESLRLILFGQLPTGLQWDVITSATPLDVMRTQLNQGYMIDEIRRSPLWGSVGGQGWEWVGLWLLLGGLWMLYRGVIEWRIPMAFLTGLAGMALLFYGVDPQSHPAPWFHLGSGGAMLGAFFIATDPVTASTTPRGQWMYGLAIGIIVFVIRSWGGYPDAVAFAVLLMNMAVPLIDYYTPPPVFGDRGIQP